jgi:hypothetical protein
MTRILPAILAVVFFSCGDSSVNNQTQNGAGILFEIENVNYAWGFFYQGIMIDQDGGVYSYNPAKDSVHFLYNADEGYTVQELQSKYQHGKTYLKQVTNDSLKWARDAASQVTTNDFSDTTRVGADMGSIIYSVYIYRPQTNKYQKNVLKVEGDATFYNKSESAIALVLWLKTL